MVTRIIIEEFKNKNNISLTADNAKNINTLLVKEYMKEYRGEAA
jgi:type I restriction enzyme R subunit